MSELLAAEQRKVAESAVDPLQGNAQVQAKAEISLADQQDRQIEHIFRSSAQLLKKQPSLVMTGLYLVASSLGLLFTVTLLQHFDFSILPYLELTDFLLAAVAYPVTMLVLLIAFFLLFLVFVLERAYRKRSPRYALATERVLRQTNIVPAWLALMLCVVSYIYVAGTSKAPSVARDIKQGLTQQFSLSLIYPMNPGGAEVRMLQPVQLISRTSSYLVLYYDKQVMLIPHANVASFVPLPKPGQKTAAKAVPAVAEMPLNTEQNVPGAKEAQSKTPVVKSPGTEKPAEPQGDKHSDKEKAA